MENRIESYVYPKFVKFTVVKFKVSLSVDFRFGVLLCIAVWIASVSLGFAQMQFTIKEALKIAQKNNPTLKAEKFNLNIAETQITQAKVISNPTINNQTLFMGRSSLFPPNTTWYSPQNNQTWWQLTKVFKVAGQRRNQIKIAKEEANKALYTYMEIERNILKDVSDKWLQVWLSQKQLELINIAKKNIDSLAYINKIRYKNERITLTDLLRTDLLSRQYDIRQKNALQMLKNKQKELKILLNVKDSLVVVDVPVITFEESIPCNINLLLQDSLKHRADIKMYSSQIEISDHNIKLQKSLAFPAPELGAIYNPQNSVPYYGLYATIELPFFNRNQSQIRRSHIEKSQTIQEMENIKIRAKTELDIAYTDYLLQKTNVDKVQSVIGESEIILKNVRYAYLKNGTTIIDVFEAQRSWIETQQLYYETLFTYRESYIRLLYALGVINQVSL